MRQTLIQNIDAPKPNPLIDKTPKPPKVPIRITKNPKTVTIIIISGIILLLLIAGLFVSQSSKNSTNTPPISQIVPTTTAIPNPIPTQHINQFSQVKKILDENPIINPPQIDSTIGL